LNPGTAAIKGCGQSEVTEGEVKRQYRKSKRAVTIGIAARNKAPNGALALKNSCCLF
jgi:hypothetical protein